jgi:hypothetical protein
VRAKAREMPSYAMSIGTAMATALPVGTSLQSVFETCQVNEPPMPPAVNPGLRFPLDSSDQLVARNQLFELSRAKLAGAALPSRLQVLPGHAVNTGPAFPWWNCQANPSPRMSAKVSPLRYRSSR